MSIAGTGRGPWQSDVASLPQRGARSSQRQPTDPREGSHWFGARANNINRVLVANNGTELHNRTGDAAIFVDERGQRINGQWTGSPAPVEHDILTGSNADGTLMTGMTCTTGRRRRRTSRRRSAIPTASARARAPRAHWRHGTRRTRTRTAQHGAARRRRAPLLLRSIKRGRREAS